VKLPEKIEIFRKFAWKNRYFFTWIHHPQTSNQIDAADEDYVLKLHIKIILSLNAPNKPRYRHTK